jgi:phosphoglycolate phosphatase
MAEILFDFDGVIGDTWEDNWKLVQQLHPETSEQRYRIDHHLGNVFEEPAVAFTPESASRYYQLYSTALSRRHIERSIPTIKNLARLHTLHIVTSNCEEAIGRVLTDAGIRDLFTNLLGKQTHPSKVEKFKTIIKTAGTSPQSCIFVTDTLGDIKEAKVVDLPTIAVSFGYHPREVLESGQPLAIVDTWEELIQTIEKLNN